MTATTETEVLPEGYDQERWDELTGAIRKLDEVEALLTMTRLVMNGFSGKLPTPDEVENINEALVEAARQDPALLALSAIQGIVDANTLV